MLDKLFFILKSLLLLQYSRNKLFYFLVCLVTSFALVVILLFALIISSLFERFNENWVHLQQFVLLSVFIDTLLLVVLNVLGSVFLGISLAWLVCRYNFLGQVVFDKILIFPITIPPYIIALVFLDFFDSSGSMNEFIRNHFSIDVQFDFSNSFVVSMAMIFSLYPYAYLMFRSSFHGMQNSMVESAQILGMSEKNIFLKVAFPLARPTLIAVSGIVIMESFADFGTASIFNYDTITVLIYKTWFSLFDIVTAMQLAAILLLIVLLVYWINKVFTGKESYSHSKLNSKKLCSKKLSPVYSTLCFLVCFLIFMITFVTPVLSLVFLAFQVDISLVADELFQITLNTIFLALMAVFFIVSMSFMIVTLEKELFNKGENSLFKTTLLGLFKITNLGYTMPGIVLSIGVLNLLLIVTGYFNLGVIMTQSVAALIFVYACRFIAVANNTLLGSIVRLGDGLSQVALTMGFSKLKIISNVYFPNLKLPLLTAGILIFVEVVKELPATLMMRPFGWDTLAVNMYSYTTEGEWASAAIISLTIIGLSMIFILFLTFNKRFSN